MDREPTSASRGRRRSWPWRRPDGRLRRWPLVLGALLLVLLIVILVFDWNWFKGPVERAVQANTGREFHIDGNLDVALGGTTTIRGDGLRFANADWSKQPQMASAQRAEIDLALWPLLRGKLRIPEIRLTQPQLLLETGPNGQAGNWSFGSSDGGMQATLGRLLVQQGRLKFQDLPGRTDIDVSVDSLTAQRRRGDAAPPIAVAGDGRWRGNPFTLKGSTASPLELSESDHPFKIDLRGSAGSTRAHMRGTLTNPFQLRVFDLQLSLAGTDMQHLYPLLGIAIPSTPPYQLDGRLKRNGDVWRYEDFNGRAGDSDLAGSVQIDTAGQRPFLRADLRSRRLDFDDLAGFVGAPPRTGAGETANAEQKAQAAKLAADAKVLPATPYDLGKLRAMDADVRWKAQRINAQKLPLDDMDAHLKLNDGVLLLQPLDFGVAGGNIRSDIRMDARKPTIATRAQISLRGMQLGKLFPDGQLAKEASGAIGGEIALAGTGNSIAQMLGSADGSIAIGMGKGHISNLIMELAGLDIAESLKFLITKDREIPVRCAFGDFAVRNGVMDARALAFDSTDTLIVGSGNIDLGDETLDLLLKARPKDRSILSLRSPLRVGGTFKDPTFRPDVTALGMRGAIALALGSIAPPAALLATLETGPGKDADCGGHYAK
ncbi:AsmA family protein [Xanthomonas hyacinthi]|uniref:AsmA family protein n=1 Tax=Xanthomonas hyacinthi TaxID=56455 RepID=A0A2S7F2G7_9XANT|nr:AsmA family protein [Xanthomonas hyacinthi]KLD80237.1 membrane protein [Xanthomonas hyacinthi DSM 19077]PPU99642.1 AsmA family protein [Xanthomonas hyacinthi]QGY75777.1 AsmA family protein [Xanthomonas hyacinthi]